MNRKKTPRRPFPWTCPDCLKDTVDLQIIRYETEVKHDGVLHRLDISEFQVPKCQSCQALVFDIDADDRISAALREKLDLLSPQEIRARRIELGLDQKALAEQLGLAKETISRWETGALIQSRLSDNILRLYFELPAVRAASAARARNCRAGETGKHASATKPASKTLPFSVFPLAVAERGSDRLAALVEDVQSAGSPFAIG
jgi:putative zinc finger/helix-turn-helix YgiT family protein